ncbi:MAG: FHA domain-containing protein [candidate division Zixibacteria bacterium]|nr:FHA domain-containing protein [candidate division Zixibacteria bacterium]
MPEIIVKYDDRVIEKVVTEKPRISIGRTSDNDIVLDNRGVSRKHALIEIDNGSALIIDNDSLNGTFVNDRKITEENLRDQDRISIGKYDLVFNVAKLSQEKLSDMDGTMILQTKAQQDRLANDRSQREVTSRLGCSVLVGVDNKGEKNEYPLDQDVNMIGKTELCQIKIGGFFAPKMAAKIERSGMTHTLVNLARQGHVKVNGEAVERYDLKNNDLVQIGKQFFKFIEAV